MKYYKGEINNTLSYVLYYEDDNYRFSYNQGVVKKEQLLGYTPEDKVNCNYNITVEELKKEFNIQLERVKNKVEEVKEYFDGFKGQIINSLSLEYNLKEFYEISPLSIAVLPSTVTCDEDKEELREVINFKPDKDTIYDGPIYLETYIDEDGSGEPEFIEAQYVIDRAIFVGLSECKMKYKALCLAIYNKIGTIFNSHSVFLEDFEALLEGDITMKGFIKKFDITKKKTVC